MQSKGEKMLFETLKSIMKHEGVVNIVAQGDDFPHVVNTWNSYVLVKKDHMILPVGGMNQMEEILKKKDKVLVVVGSKEVDGLHESGAGLHIDGIANIQCSGNEYDMMKEKFAWARAIMKIDIVNIEQKA